ncbi:hypothetical protein DFQ07_2967 [Tenacibaculum caenipelagi]|uniref:Uncharacterized protein n=1 Tax=Tenacibaculum caenipelagi TaxID=1325435 RepID=A0A4R6T900_9FLAO|nr:hypothetical protein DFQ07_2967 [Tenacibaculum caenipelagi]
MIKFKLDTYISDLFIVIFDMNFSHSTYDFSNADTSKKTTTSSN